MDGGCALIVVGVIGKFPGSACTAHFRGEGFLGMPDNDGTYFTATWPRMRLLEKHMGEVMYQARTIATSCYFSVVTLRGIASAMPEYV